jgi:hypothetical protein
MRGTVAKRIRREHHAARGNAVAQSYQIGSNGMVLADRGRRTYQMRKEKYYNGR